MKKLIVFFALIVVSVIFQVIAFFPWWSFLIPIFIMGIILPIEKWKISAFLFGFASGFIVWCLFTFYFELDYQGNITETIGKMMKMPRFIVYIITGFIGGILTGLAFYSGYLLRRGKEPIGLTY